MLARVKTACSKWRKLYYISKSIVSLTAHGHLNDLHFSWSKYSFKMWWGPHIPADAVQNTQKTARYLVHTHGPFSCSCYMEHKFEKRKAILSKLSRYALEKEIPKRKTIIRENDARRKLNTERKTYAYFIVPLNISIPSAWLKYFPWTCPTLAIFHFSGDQRINLKLLLKIGA